MKFRHIGLFIIIIAVTFNGCNGKSFGMVNDSEIMPINRFDAALFQWIDSDDSTVLAELKNKYPQMLDVLGNSLFTAEYTDVSILFNYIINYYSEPTLKSLYKDAMSFYSGNSQNTEDAIKELSYGFMQLKQLFPSMQIPAIYMHVSGLHQNIIVADSLLSFSIDKYLGLGYAPYEKLVNSFHQRKSMIPERMVKDGLSGWLKSEFPYKGKDNVLLERMIYEGKIIHVLIKAGYDYNFKNITSTTDDEYKWCLNYESTLWTTIIERKHLFTDRKSVV